MSKHDPRLSLTQMREAAHRAYLLCEGTTLEELLRDWIRLTSFERQFEIIGEAIKRLPLELGSAIRSTTGAVLPGCGTSWRMATIGLTMRCCGTR